MNDKHFDTILAKNEIARELKRWKNDLSYPAEVRKFFRQSVSMDYLLHKLEEIEAYVGTGNQPSVKEIMESKLWI